MIGREDALNKGKTEGRKVKEGRAEGKKDGRTEGRKTWD